MFLMWGSEMGGGEITNQERECYDKGNSFPRKLEQLFSCPKILF